MKRSILVLSLLLIGAGSAVAQKKVAPAKKPAAAAQGPQQTNSNTFSCTIDGKSYRAVGSKVYTMAKLKTYKDPPYLSVTVFSQPTGLHYSLEFQLPPDGALAPGDYPVGNGETLEARFPAAYFDITDERTKDLKAFSHMLEGGGTVTVTSVAGGWVEGTFAFNLSGGSDGKCEVTNGAFRFKMPPIEKK